MKKPRLVNEQIYHIYNRGVEKRDIFLEENDYFRFIHDLLNLMIGLLLKNLLS